MLNKNSWIENILAMVTLGLLCGWYFVLLLFVYPLVIFWIFYYKSITAASIMALFILLAVIPLDHKPKKWFTSCFIWRIWQNYFDFSIDCSNCSLEDGKRYLFLDFPHGIFPMAQFLCANKMDEISPGGCVCGTGNCDFD